MDKEQAFTEVFAREYTAVLAFARRRVGHQSGEETAAETFTIAWRRWDGAPAEPRPWLFGIAKNVIRDQLRGDTRRDRLTRELIMVPKEPSSDPGHEVPATLDLERAWSRLTPADREVIALVAWDGLTGAQAARVLSLSRVAYAARLSRARARLKKHLEQNQ